MYGKMMRDRDYDELLAKSSVSEIAEYLVKSESTGAYLGEIKNGDIHRAQLEYQLGLTLIEQCLRLYGMIFGKEKQILWLRLYNYEKENLLSFFRHLISKSEVDFFFHVNDFIKNHSKIPYGSLACCHTFSEAAQVLSTTPYGAILSDLLLESEPDYNAIEKRLIGNYFETVRGLIETSLNKSDAEALLKQFTVETDFLNMMRILRIKKYYPNVNIEDQLLSGGHRVKGAFLHELAAARDFDSAYALIKTTGYGRYFDREKLLDNAYFEYLDRYSRRIVSGGGATILCVPAYLNLKKIEIHNIVTIIEGKRYGCSTEAIAEKLVGYHKRR